MTDRMTKMVNGLLPDGTLIRACEATFDHLEKQDDRIEKLVAALREIHEVYAGSEGIPEPMTATEGYLLKLLTEMVGVTRKALEGKDD